MEHILISPGKLKLMLTKNDMEHYELDLAAVSGEETLRRSTLKELLSDIKAISGFDAADDKVFIQLYPSKDGGGELYITRLSRQTEGNTSDNESTVKLTAVYAFPSVTALVEGCARMGKADGCDSASAWYGDSGCYLMCERRVTYREYLRDGADDRLTAVIGEYGRRLRDSRVQYYIKEHCVCLCERDAVSVLGKLK